MSKRALTALLLCSTFMMNGCNQSTDANLPLKMAEKEVSQAHYAEGLLHLKRAVQLEPDNIQARKLMAEVLLVIGDPGQAELHIQKAVELGIARAEIIILQGLSLIKQKKYDAVLESLVIEGDLMDLSAEQQALIYAIRGQAQLAKSMYTEAEHSFQRASNLDGSSTRAIVGLAALKFQQGQHAQAEEYIAKAISIDEKDIDAWTLKGDFARIQGKLNQAEDAYTQVIAAVYPTSIEGQYARLYRAMVFAAHGKIDEAWADVRKVRASSGDHLFVNYVSGVVAFYGKDYAKAQGALEKVLSITPDHLFAHYLLGASHYLQNQPAQARKHLVYFVNANPEHELAQKMLAMTEFSIGESASAVARLNDIISRHPDDIQALNLLGQHYLASGQVQKGVQTLAQSLEANPLSEGAQLRYGLGQMEAGEFRIAEKAFTEALNINKESKPAQFYRFISAFKEGQPDKAIELADRLLAENPQNTIALNFKGIGYTALGNIEQAKQQFEAVLALDKGDPTAHFNLANIALSADDKASAKQHFDKVVENHPKFIRGYLKQAHFALKYESLAQAKQWLVKARQAQPDDISAALALAKIISIENKPAEALTILTSLSESAKNTPQVLLELASLYANTDQTANAHQSLNQYQNKYPSLVHHPRYLSLRAILFGKEKQYDKAAQLYEQLQKRDPNERWVVGLAAQLWDANQTSRSNQVLEQWITTNPQSSIAQIALANNYMRQENFSKALDAFYKADQLVPNHPLILNNLAWLLKDQDLNKAHEFAERALKLSSDNNIKNTYDEIQKMRGGG